MDALVDLTGGLAERYELKGADPSMYRHLHRAHKSGAFIVCSRKVSCYNVITVSSKSGAFIVCSRKVSCYNVITVSSKSGAFIVCSRKVSCYNVITVSSKSGAFIVCSRKVNCYNVITVSQSRFIHYYYVSKFCNIIIMIIFFAMRSRQTCHMVTG